ncbi:MAG: GNAT family N-acetyltransferase [Parcubacteria group bacterium]|nr:GNAT family N-acetyltransferase [Parcubacteria group bacterium]
MPFNSTLFRIDLARLDDYRDCITFLNERGDELLQSGLLPYQDVLHQRRLMERARTRISVIRQQETGRVVGVAMLCITYDWRKGVGHVEYVLVDEDFRGDGRGLGRALMENLLDQAVGVSPLIKVVRLVSEPWHEAARALYENLGFKLVEGSDRHYELDLVRYLELKVQAD